MIRPFLVLFALLLTACASHKPVADTVPVRKPGEEQVEGGNVQKDQRAQVMSLFMDGTRARLAGDPSAAMRLYEQCLKVDPKNAASMFELSKLYDQAQMAEPSLEMAKKAVATDKSNVWYRFLLADLSEKHGKVAEATEVYKGIIRDWPERTEVYFNLANSLALQGKVSEARKVYDDLEKPIGPSEELIYSEFDMLMTAHQAEDARVLMEQAVATDPGNVSYYGMLAQAYDDLGQGEKALEQYQKVLALEPDDSMTRISLAEHYYGTGEMDKAFEQLNIAFADPDLDVDAKMQLVLGFFQNTHPEGEGTSADQDLLAKSYELITTMEKAHPESGKPNTLHGDFLLRDGKIAEAREQFRRASRYEKDKFPIWQQLVQIDLQLKDDSSLHADASGAMELFPSQPSLYLYDGIALGNLKRYDEAIEVLITGRDLVVDDKATLAQFWSTLGDTYNEAKQYEKSDEAYEKSLAQMPDNANALNNFSYYLSVRGEKLDKAEQMSRKSNELAPNQPSYQDTYAWVLFRQGKYADARIWAEKAIQSGGGDEGEVIEHYGDILFKLGDSAGALEQWKRAQQLGDTSEDIGRKVSEGRLPE